MRILGTITSAARPAGLIVARRPAGAAVARRPAGTVTAFSPPSLAGRGFSARFNDRYLKVA